MNIDKEFKTIIPPLATDELKQLEKNLISEGWRDNEKIITWNDYIIDGHNRYSLCRKNNISFKIQKKKFKDKNEAIIWIINNQLGRRNLPDYARVELNLKKEPMLKQIAKENQMNPFGKKVPQETKGCGLIKPHPFTSYGTKETINRVNDKIGEMSKVSDETVRKVKFIRDNADEDIKTKLRSGNKELSINKVYIDLKKKQQREKVIEEFRDAPKLNNFDKKYKIIYADPPWKYYAGGNKNQSQHYKSMTIEEIKNLPVEKLADDNCILFLWVTFPMLPDVFDVITAWGFKYSTCGFNWVKRNKSSNGWFFGLGNWTRSNSELCLIATKGSPIRQSASVHQIIDTPLEGHSKKPDCVRTKIVELVGDLPRIELFARNKTAGWDVWGNQYETSNGNY